MLSAIMHPLGRVILGTLFPKHYQNMVERCTKTGESLEDQERQVFPTSPTEMLSHLLASWQVAPDVYVPLKFSSLDFPLVARLPEPTRTKTELVKVAVLLGQLAVNRWEQWDLVQFPPATLLKRLGATKVDKLISEVMTDVNQLAQFRPGARPRCQGPSARVATRAVPYVNLTGEPIDFVPHFVESIGLQADTCSLDELAHLNQAAIVNALGVPPDFLVAQHCAPGTVVVSNHDTGDLAALRIASLPSSYRCFCKTLSEFSHMHDSHSTVAAASTVAV
jgi:hypothetical protein